MESMARCQRLDDAWQVKVCDNRGNTVGAGVLLAYRYILTCAHVARNAGVSATGHNEPDARLWIESVLCLPQWRTPARVMPGSWISDRQTRHGDLTLLELDTPVTCHTGAAMLQAPVRGPIVSVCGFPAGGSPGIRAEGELVGASNDGAWVEIRATRKQGQWITRGYSGAGVIDNASRLVVGIVMAAVEPDATVAYMMPVEAIVSHLPLVGSFVEGGRTSDGSFRDRADDLIVPNHRKTTRPEIAVDAALRQEIGGLLTGVWAGTAIVTGGDPDTGSSWLARLVVTADPAARQRIPAEAIVQAPPGAVLGVGAIDLAIDAAGRSVPWIRRRIAERFGIPDDDSAGLVGQLLHRQPPPVLVIDRVDSANDAAQLIRELLAPLAARAQRRRLRLVLGFTGPLPAGLDYQTRLGPEPVTGDALGAADPDTVRQLLAELANAEEELVPLYARVSARVADLPRLPPSLAPWLRVRNSVSAGERPAAELAQIGDRARTAKKAVARLSEQLRRSEQKHAELGLTLDVYRDRAEQRFGAEDRELARLYRRARETLTTGPCDLGAGRAAVDEYIDAIRGRDRR